MDKDGKLIILLFSILIACFLAFIFLTYTNNVPQDPNLSGNVQINASDMLEMSQRDVDRSLNILNMVSTLIGVLAALIAILVAIGAALGLSEFSKWKEIRKETENHKDEIKTIAEEVGPIFESIKKMENDVKNVRNRIMHQPFAEKPSEELKQEVDKSEKNIRLRESFGIPLTSEDYYIRATDYSYKNDHESALDALNKALELDPNDVDTLVNKAVALIRLKRLDEALEVINKAISLYPKYAIAWFNKACIYSLKGDKDNTLKTLARAIELDSIFKEMAKNDDDFKNLWDDPKFKELVK